MQVEILVISAANLVTGSIEPANLIIRNIGIRLGQEPSLDLGSHRELLFNPLLFELVLQQNRIPVEMIRAIPHLPETHAPFPAELEILWTDSGRAVTGSGGAAGG